MTDLTTTTGAGRPCDREELQSWVLDDPAALSTLRAALFEAVTGQVMTAQFTLGGVADRLVLVATELATNSLTGGVPPTTVRLSRAGGDLFLDVSDRAAREPESVPAPDENRLWLRMARRLSSEVGWHTTDSVTHVWARFDDALHDAAGR